MWVPPITGIGAKTARPELAAIKLAGGPDRRNGCLASDSATGAILPAVPAGPGPPAPNFARARGRPHQAIGARPQTRINRYPINKFVSVWQPCGRGATGRRRRAPVGQTRECVVHRASSSRLPRCALSVSKCVIARRPRVFQSGPNGSGWRMCFAEPIVAGWRFASPQSRSAGVIATSRAERCRGFGLGPTDFGK